MKELKNGDVVYVDKTQILGLVWSALGLDTCEQIKCRFVGWSTDTTNTTNSVAVVERGAYVFHVHADALRTRACVTVKLWRTQTGDFAVTHDGLTASRPSPAEWKYVAQHTFEIDEGQDDAAR